MVRAMVSRRRLRRNLRRLFIPVETALVWTAGPLVLGFYWLAHLLAQGARMAANLWR
jgi:hypothetical protein